MAEDARGVKRLCVRLGSIATYGGWMDDLQLLQRLSITGGLTIRNHRSADLFGELHLMRPRHCPQYLKVDRHQICAQLPCGRRQSIRCAQTMRFAWGPGGPPRAPSGWPTLRPFIWLIIAWATIWSAARQRRRPQRQSRSPGQALISCCQDRTAPVIV
jgi:hypothetical protein